jgi:FtsH-binding integral membrane protein
LSLAQAAQTVLEECRMVLPGIQAILGFQLTVVFSEGFEKRLSETGQQLHLGALLCTALAVGLVMAPAAFHRQTDPTRVTSSFIMLSSRLLLASMVPLALGISVDVYLVATVIASGAWPLPLAGGLLTFFLLVWFLLPRLSRNA